MFMSIKTDLELKISSLLAADGKTVTFKYEANNDKLQVAAFTKNNVSKEEFLLKVAIADTYIECLDKILQYIDKTANSISTFTVTWCRKENGQLNETHISYFSCHDVVEVTDKFFTGKSVNDYVIYEIKLNPIA